MTWEILHGEITSISIFITDCNIDWDTVAPSYQLILIVAYQNPNDIPVLLTIPYLFKVKLHRYPCFLVQSHHRIHV